MQSHAEQFGKAGDFYTSSDVHAVFGRLLARQFAEMWRVLGRPEKIQVKELGPGRGLFARDVLDCSEKKFPEFFRALRYILVEKSSALRQRIASTLAEHLETGRAGIDFCDLKSGGIGESAAERRKNTAHGASRGEAKQETTQAAKGRKKELPVT